MTQDEFVEKIGSILHYAQPSLMGAGDDKLLLRQCVDALAEYKEALRKQDEEKPEGLCVTGGEYRLPGLKETLWSENGIAYRVIGTVPMENLEPEEAAIMVKALGTAGTTHPVTKKCLCGCVDQTGLTPIHSVVDPDLGITMQHYEEPKTTAEGFPLPEGVDPPQGVEGYVLTPTMRTEEVREGKARGFAVTRRVEPAERTNELLEQILIELRRQGV